RQHHYLLGKGRGALAVDRCKLRGGDGLWVSTFHELCYTSFFWKVPFFLMGRWEWWGARIFTFHAWGWGGRSDEKQGEGAGPDAQDEAEAAQDFEDGDGRSQDLGQGHAELGEAAHTLVDKDELDHALPEKDPARHQADPEGRLGRPGARVHEPCHDGFH